MPSWTERRRLSDVALAFFLLVLIGLSTYYFFEQNARSDQMERRADRLETQYATSQKNLELSTAQTRRMIEQVERKGLKPAVSPTEIPAQGPQGPQGVQGLQGIQGLPGAPGAPGRGVAAIALDGCYLMVTYTNGKTDRIGPACGPAGGPGPAGPAGQDGKDGTDGQDGKDGQDGRGIASIALRCDDNPGTPQPGDGTVTFIFTFTDGTTQEASSTSTCQVA